MMNSKALLCGRTESGTFICTCVNTANLQDGGFSCSNFNPPTCVIRGEDWGKFLFTDTGVCHMSNLKRAHSLGA